jgi:hypothetical protein
VATDILIDDPAEYQAMLDFLQECGWSKDLTLADILGVEPPQRAATGTAPTTVAVSPLR